MDKAKALRLLYAGMMILGGAVMGIWSFAANRFQVSECIWITLGGMVAGLGLGSALHAMTVLLNRGR